MQDNDPITLAQAAEIFGIGVATLRAEAERGRLTIYRIGRQDRTTVNDIRAMVERCRVKSKGRGFTLIHDDEKGRDLDQKPHTVLVGRLIGTDVNYVWLHLLHRIGEQHGKVQRIGTRWQG